MKRSLLIALLMFSACEKPPPKLTPKTETQAQPGLQPASQPASQPALQPALQPASQPAPQLAPARKVEPAQAQTREQTIAALRAGAVWLPPTNRCPADEMPQIILLTKYVEHLCDGEAMVGCAQRCEGGDPQACFAVAIDIQETPGKPDPTAEALFLRACKLGEAGGCTNRTAGRLIERQNVVDDCTRRSFRRCCDANDAWACAMLAAALTDGDRAEMKRAIDKACKLAPGVAPCQAAKRVLDTVRAQDAAQKQKPK